MNLSDLQDIDIADLSTWPQWFKVVAVVAVFAGIIYSGHHFVISTQLVELERLEREEGNLRKVFLDRKGKAINLPAYREQMAKMEETFGVLVDQLPDKTEVPQLLIDITQAGLARGLEFSLFKPQNEQVGDFYATLPIDLRVRGNYHQFGQFVSDLSALPRIVTLGNLSVEGQGNGSLNVGAVVKTYRYLDEEEATPTKATKTVRTVRQ
ncbi:MAG: pilus assembly protein PilO [Proteobacteria bacterium]|nr:MAG: pilus assembly protein PilO [Pseudomonadota bacterium]